MGSQSMTNESKTVDACPICGSEIQLHETEYHSGATLEFHPKSGHLDMVETGRWVMSGDTVIYCENDHTWEEMGNALASAKEATK